MTEPFFTVGHGTRSIPEFLELLRESNVYLVVDVRSMPRSRANPQFNKEVLHEALALRQIAYEHVVELGGLRGKQHLSEPSPNGFWKVQSFRNYADYALTNAFVTGFSRLLELGLQRRCAIMCAETLWWRCHRRIIADYLLAAEKSVFHILGGSHVDEAQLNSGAVVRWDRKIIYPGAPNAERQTTSN